MAGCSAINKNKMELRNKIIHALNEIRPFLAADGGDISLVEILDEKIVKVKLHGNCAGCSVNQMTLKTGVEMTIKKHAPQIEKVVNVDETNLICIFIPVFKGCIQKLKFYFYFIYFVFLYRKANTAYNWSPVLKARLQKTLFHL